MKFKLKGLFTVFFILVSGAEISIDSIAINDSFIASGLELNALEAKK